jgi:RNA polymerase sigma factor (sigma-70 family)
MAAMSLLIEDEREALALRYGADLSFADIARVLGVPRSTVQGRVYKGLKHLRAQVDSDGVPAGATRAALP